MAKKCERIGCVEPAAKGNRCLSHYTPKAQALRYTDNARMYEDGRWQKLRHYHLNREPLCMACLLYGATGLGRHVDHIVPHKGLGPIQFLPSNLQSLCVSCHSKKTRLEQKGIIEHYKGNVRYSEATGTYTIIAKDKISTVPRNDKILQEIIRIRQAAHL